MGEAYGEITCSIHNKEDTYHGQSLGTATKWCPPNTMEFDHRPSKKPRTGHPTPEIHVAVNITPTPGEHPALQGSYIVSQTPITPLASTSAPGPSGPVQVSNTATQIASGSTPAPGPVSPLSPATHPSCLVTLLRCVDDQRVPSLSETLMLMDKCHPKPDLDYVETRSDLEEHSLEDAIDVYSLPVELLAPLGGRGHGMGRARAAQLQEFVRDRLLRPFGLLNTGGSHGDHFVGLVEKNDGGRSVESINRDVAKSVALTEKNEETPLTSTSRHKKSQEDIGEWLDGVTKVESDFGEVDELDLDADEVEGEEGDAASEEV